MLQNFVEGFMNGAFVVGSICGVIVVGFAIMGVVTVIWAVREPM